MLLLLLCRFPATAAKKDGDFYCKFNDKTLQAYSAIMHFTGALASLVAGYITQHYGRTTSMIVAGTSYILGSILQVNTYTSSLPPEPPGAIAITSRDAFGNPLCTLKETSRN